VKRRGKESEGRVREYLTSKPLLDIKQEGYGLEFEEITAKISKQTLVDCRRRRE
jgi:hypothetical protein